MNKLSSNHKALLPKTEISEIITGWRKKIKAFCADIMELNGNYVKIKANTTQTKHQKSDDPPIID